MTRPEDKHDPGGRVRITLKHAAVSDATFSECGRYRQLLIRDWTPDNTPPKSILWIGQNPSVADTIVVDPTVNREIGYTRDWGYTRYLKTNILDWRATSPRDIPHDPDVACSPENLPIILDAARHVDRVILACGKLHPRYQLHVRNTISALVNLGVQLECLGLNGDGSAKHPLYLKKTLQPFPFPLSVADT